MFVALGLTGAAGLWAFILLLRQLYYICQPSEVLIFAGLRRRTGTARPWGTARFEVAAHCGSPFWRKSCGWISAT